MGTSKDLTNLKFARLTVIKYWGRTDKGRFMWECQCDCGTIKIIEGRDLLTGHTQSCGCFMREVNSKLRETHNMKHASEYTIWRGIKDRCFRIKNKHYKDYGGRGISMYEGWRHDFLAFYNYVGPRPKGKSIDRIDNNMGYFPGNVRWATAKQQMNNTRKVHRKVDDE